MLNYSLDRGVTRHAKGAWMRWDGTEQTHSWIGAVMYEGERIFFEAYRYCGNVRRKTEYLVRLSYANDRELTAAKWNELRDTIEAEFKSLIFVGVN